MTEPVPYEVSPGDIQLKINTHLQNPNVGRVVSTTLKNGPKSFRFATMFEIIEPVTRGHHHWCLRLDSFDRKKVEGWVFKGQKSVTLEDTGSGTSALRQLVNMVDAALGGHLNHETGQYDLVLS